MKILKKHLKPISFLLAFTILLQGCTIYKKQNISLEEAATIQGDKVKKKVKLVTLDNETQKYKYVIPVNNEYFGVRKGQYGLTKIPLKQENLKTVKIEDTVATLVVGVLSFIGILIITAGVVFAIEGGFAVSFN